MKRFILILVAILALLGVAAAQEPTDKEREAKERRELEKKTLALLNEVASASWGLKAPENRSFVMVSAANLLWDSDQKRARTLYWDALNSLNLNSPTRTLGENASKAERDKVAQEFVLTFELRQTLLRKVARRDAQLALDMLRATRQVLPQKFAQLRHLDDRELEQEIAAEVVTRDPAEALNLARESLAKGVSHQVMNLLYLLNRKDREKASQFAGEIITKLRTTNLATDLRASVIAIELLQTSRTSTSGGRLMNASGISVLTVLSLSDEQKRELVDSLTNAALTISANSNLLYQITELMPEVDQFFPERRAALQKKLAAFNQTLNKEQREGNEFNEMIRLGMAEELVRKASSPEGEKHRPVWYGQAAIIAAARGQTDSFREFIGKEIKDDDARNKVLAVLDTQELELAVYQKRVEDLQRLLPKIRRNEERARAMAELALMLKEKGDDEAATSLLDEAATLIKTNFKSESQSYALLALLAAYAVVDPPKAFALAERTIDEANAQLSMLLLLDRVFKSGVIKKGEILLEQTALMPIDYMVFKYKKGMLALVKADFGRTRALAERFDRNELRVMARLLLVMSLMDTTKSP